MLLQIHLLCVAVQTSHDADTAGDVGEYLHRLGHTNVSLQRKKHEKAMIIRRDKYIMLHDI